MELIQLNISAIRQSDAQNNAYVLLLNETVGERQLPVVIGWCEARAIAVALDSKEKPERPLTHDLFKACGEKFNISVSKMVIHKLIEGVFHSTLYCKNLITNEESEPVEAFMEEQEFTFPITYLIIGEKAPIDANTVPASYVIDKSGNIVIHEEGISDWNTDKTYTLLDELIAE